MNDIVVGAADTVGEPVRASVTGIKIAEPPDGVMVTEPEYGVDDAGKADGSTPICKV